MPETLRKLCVSTKLSQRNLCGDFEANTDDAGESRKPSLRILVILKSSPAKVWGCNNFVYSRRFSYTMLHANRSNRFQMFFQIGVLNNLFLITCFEVFCKKGVLRNFAKCTGKHLCQSFFFNKVVGLSFPVNFAKFLRTSYRTPWDDCFWITENSRNVERMTFSFIDFYFHILYCNQPQLKIYSL